jgi:hypothetical protein
MPSPQTTLHTELPLEHSITLKKERQLFEHISNCTKSCYMKERHLYSLLTNVSFNCNNFHASIWHRYMSIFWLSWSSKNNFTYNCDTNSFVFK